jgi:hypothetical protein
MLIAKDGMNDSLSLTSCLGFEDLVSTVRTEIVVMLVVILLGSSAASSIMLLEITLNSFLTRKSLNSHALNTGRAVKLSHYLSTCCEDIRRK